MNALTASLIVALVSAIALIAAAFVTARGRIGVLPPKATQAPSDASRPATDVPESATQFRGMGWVLVVLLYLVAVFCVMQGLSALRIVRHWQQWQAYFGSGLSDRAEIALYAKFWIATAIALCLIGFWAQRRLRRRS